ncbi:hypothetical protein [Erysipelothrix sp. HDW6A]|uniref:hypothetical protein n=1 Tax=Erysipelothrix sp. HDW6A TaxID=2714928 RepID=UPI00196A6814|nr:hypothetical protein [Erysipelothrix sp. HDW6A]
MNREEKCDISTEKINQRKKLIILRKFLGLFNFVAYLLIREYNKNEFLLSRIISNHPRSSIEEPPKLLNKLSWMIEIDR